MHRLKLTLSLAICGTAFAATMHNNDVVRMVRQGASVVQIVNQINATEPGFTMYPEDFSALREDGVPEVVIRAMQARMRGERLQLGTSAVSVQVPAPSQPSPTAERPTSTQVQQPPYNSPEPPVARISNVPESRQAPLGAQAVGSYLSSGMWELGVEGTVIVPHTSPSDTEGLLSTRLGRMITDGNEVGVDMTLLLQKDIQDVYLSGFYRYNFGSTDSRLRPFVGAGAGVNVINLSSLATESNVLARGEAGLRYFVGQNVSFDVAYNLLYVRIRGLGFKDSSVSLISAGFSYVF